MESEGISISWGICQAEPLASSGGLFMRTKGIGITWGLGYAMTKLLVMFGGWVMRNEATGIVWGLGDTKQSCWDRLGAE